MNKIIGRNLKSAREKIGYTQTQIAKYLKISRSTLCNYEAGKKSIPSDKLYLLAKLYNTSVLLLFKE